MSLKTLKSEFKNLKTKIHPLLFIAIKEDVIDKLNVKKSVMFEYHEKMTKARDAVIKKEIIF